MIPTVEPSAGASEKTTMEMQYIKSDTLIIIFMILDQTHTERSCMYRFKSKTNEQPCWRPAPFQRRRKWQICEEQLRLKRIASYQNCVQPKLQWTPVFNQTPEASSSRARARPSMVEWKERAITTNTVLVNVLVRVVVVNHHWWW